MSYVPFKAVAIMRDLEVRLKNRISGLVLAPDLDANRFPIVKMTSAAGDDIWMRFRTDYERSEADGHVDGLGMAQRVYSPHVAELWIEDASAPATSYDAATVAYAVGDLVSLDGITYICIQINGTGSAVKDPATEAAYWTAYAAPSVGYSAFVAQVVAEVAKVGTKVVLKSAEGVNAAANWAAVLALSATDTVIRSDDINPLTSQI